MTASGHRVSTWILPTGARGRLRCECGFDTGEDDELDVVIHAFVAHVTLELIDTFRDLIRGDNGGSIVNDADIETGHCKDIGHVRVTTVRDPSPGGKRYASATFLASTSCVNVPGYDGWAVQLVLAADGPRPRPGLRLLPALAEVFPSWLRRAARTALAGGVDVQIEHTVGGDWAAYTVLTPEGAKSLARSVSRAVAQAPAGEFG